jgi:F-type H+-transporting ATPase subunit gamma
MRDWTRLLDDLIRRHTFVSLYRAYAESLAAENAARLAMMQSAESNIQERLDQLQMSYFRRRQADVTEELLDVIAGFETLEEEEN